MKKMNKTTLSLIVIAVVILATGTISRYFFNNTDSETIQSASKSTLSTKKSSTVASKSSEKGQSTSKSTVSKREFRGTKGMEVVIDSKGFEIEVSEVDDGKAHYFNTELSNGQSVYFFIVKSPDGKMRAAANGCQVCGRALQGFRQEGEYMVCNTCGNKYHLNQVASEKGGCNPAPISPNMMVINGKVLISTSQLAEIQVHFI